MQLFSIISYTDLKSNCRCKDKNGRIIIIPFNNQATMFDIADGCDIKNLRCNTPHPGTGDVDNENPVPGIINTHTMINAGFNQCPQVIHHIAGKLPNLSTAFTGLLYCDKVSDELTVLASSIKNNHNTQLTDNDALHTCLELSTDSDAHFNVALNGNELQNMRQYLQALHISQIHCPVFARSIKTCFTVKTKNTCSENINESLRKTAGKSNSRRTTSSDMTELTRARTLAGRTSRKNYLPVKANSEFEFTRDGRRCIYRPNSNQSSLTSTEYSSYTTSNESIFQPIHYGLDAECASSNSSNTNLTSIHMSGKDYQSVITQDSSVMKQVIFHDNNIAAGKCNTCVRLPKCYSTVHRNAVTADNENRSYRVKRSTCLRWGDENQKLHVVT